MADPPIVLLEQLDDENENWTQTLRARRLRDEGWTGTVAEWVTATNELGPDPLKHDPPLKSLEATRAAIRAGH